MSIKLKHSGGNSVSLNPPTSAPTSSEVAFKLPIADGSAGQVLTTDGSGNLSWVSQPTAGITMHDVWTISSAFNASGDITANLIRVNAYAGTIGSAMTESSGIFTFPSTGIYKVVFHIMWRVASGSATRYLSDNIYKTTDNSNYTLGSNTSGSVNPANSNSTYQQTTANFFFDVTNTSTHKVKFNAQAENTSEVNVEHGNSYLTSFMSFTRLGDT